jgi:hypothetical protein
MSEPDWNPDTAGRSLAEILREAGIERANRRRRSWDDPDETAIRQRRAEAAADRSNTGGFGRRKSDFAERIDAQAAAAAPSAAEPSAAAPPVERRQSRRPVPEPSTAAIPGLRPDRKPGVPHPSGPLPSGPIPPMRERRAADEVPAARERSAPRSAGPRSTGSRRAVVADHPSTGPIPVVRPEDVDRDLDGDLDGTPKESALAWLRFAGELVIALAAGVGVYFAATLLWEQLPHLAVFLAPLAVAGLVAGVSMWRQRQGREPIGPLLLALLVFAGTLLTIAPAAGLLATGGS